MKILDADYSAIDLADHCNGLKHLDLEGENILYSIASLNTQNYSLEGLGKAARNRY
jgi:hypothetical protein